VADVASRVLLLAGVAVATTGVALSFAMPVGAISDLAHDQDRSSYVVTSTRKSADSTVRVTTPPVPGRGRATSIVVPSIGLQAPVVRGTDDAALARGVGQWQNDTGPGERGNYVLAGHRVTHGEPFADLPDVRAGDRVVIKTADYRFVYKMDTAGDAYRVDDRELWPVQAMPRPMRGGPNRILTLITCAETFHTDDRFVAFGHLVAVKLRPDSPADPAAARSD
jgi:sortase A